MERRATPRPQLLLIVDDADDQRQLWRAWLDLWGFTSAEASDGAEAVVLARQLRPRAIVMDLRMPRVDGTQAVRQLREQPETAAIPVLGITAEHESATTVRDFRMLCDVVLHKPVDLESLLAHVRSLLARSSAK